MNLVAAGAFTMGANPADYVAECEKFIKGEWCKKWAFPQIGPPHQVTLDSFYIDQYEVTNARYKACVDSKTCASPQDLTSFTNESYYGNSKFDNYPVINVDWNQAKAYCEWRGARLPTEAEWEKAARGTDERTYPWGNEDTSCKRASHRQGDMDSTDFCTKDTAEVGSYPTGASPYGVLDMGGNVSEWTADWFAIDYYATSPANNPQGPASGEKHVIRGGSWEHHAYLMSVYGRMGLPSNLFAHSQGFRCAKSAQ
jgi:formylglycine-generating enzyme required for sulfatase activity